MESLISLFCVKLYYILYDYIEKRKEKETLVQSAGLAEWRPYLKSNGDLFLSFLAIVRSPVSYHDWQGLSNINSDAASTVIKC